MIITTRKEPGQISQDEIKEKILNTLNEHVLEQLHCLLCYLSRDIFFNIVPSASQKKCKDEIFDIVVISKLHSILLKSIT